MPVRFAIAVVTALTLSFLSPALAGAQAAASYGAEPLGAEPEETARGWFTLAAAPGATLDRAVRLRNTSPAPITFGIGAVGASTMDIGGVSYDANDHPGAGAATWVSLPQPAIVVPPGDTVDVPFSVRVPDDADPGDHLAGLAVWDSDEQAREETSGGGFGATITIRSRRVIALQLSVAGAASTALAVDAVTAGARPDGGYLLLGLSNSGGRLTTATGTVRVPSEGFEQSFDVDTFVPGTSIEYPVKWPDGDLPRAAEVEVVLDVDGGDEVRYAGTVRFDDEVRTELADRMVDTAEAPEVSAVALSDPRRWLVPASVAGLLTLLAAALLLRRRSRRGRAAAPGDELLEVRRTADLLLVPSERAHPARLAHASPRRRRWGRYTPLHSASANRRGRRAHS